MSSGAFVRGSLASAVALLTGFLVPSALAQPPDNRTIHFSAHYTDPGDHYSLGGLDTTCDVGQLSLRGSAYFDQGQLRATDTSSGCLSWDPATQLNALGSMDGVAVAFDGSTDDHIVGWLDGCGTGSFTMHQTDVRVTSVDPVAHTLHLTLKWVVAAGSGTGAFRGASGEGNGSGDATGSPDLTVSPPIAPFATPNSGTYVGTITCPHHE